MPIWLLQAEAVLGGRHERAQLKVEEVELDQRRRVAEELDVAGHGAPQQRRTRALCPGAGEADDHRGGQADERQPDRHPEAVDEAAAVVAVVDEGDRKSVGEGKSVSVRVDHGGRRSIKKKKKKK